MEVIILQVMFVITFIISGIINMLGLLRCVPHPFCFPTPSSTAAL